MVSQEQQAGTFGFTSKDGAYEEKPPIHAVKNNSLVPEAVLKHSQDEDEAMKAFAEAEGVSLHIDEATNRRLRNRIDWNLVPVSYVEVLKTCRADVE